MKPKKPAIIVISSHVVRGTVGNRAAAFALEVMGFDVWCVPTVTLPWHPGHGPSTRIVPPNDAFAAMLADLGSSPWLGDVGAILTGYLGDVGQVEPVAQLVEKLQASKPDALYALDPVMGDGGSLYISEAQAESIRERLLALADLVTPNRFELEWLTGKAPLNRQEDVVDAALKLPAKLVLATSSPSLMRNATGNLLVQSDKFCAAEHSALTGPPNGLGDLTAALMTGHLVNGVSPINGLQRTTASVFEVMAHSAKDGRDELALEQNVSSLVWPTREIPLRTLHIQRS